MSNKQAFYSQLKRIFAGREFEEFKGKSGFANLLQIKAKYFKHIKDILEEKIKKLSNQDEIYEKAWTFFDSYLNETGTPYFNKSEFYKNLYERVYSNTSDTALFYKTSRLYYVKSDTIPTDAKFSLDNVKIIFKVCENLQYSSTNEKKELKFILKELNKSEKSITLLITYKGQKVDLGNELSFELNSKVVDNELELISNNKANIKKFNELLKEYELDVTLKDIAKAINSYKKQKEIDFFIHKDSEKFLKEQFNIYLYHYLFKDSEIEFNEWSVERLEQIKNIKEIVFETIELISRFEDELKAMWLKPKFVRSSNYIITLDKIDKKYHKELLENKSLQKEWEELGFDLENKYLPVDTKYLDDDLKYKILSSFDNLDDVVDGVLIKSDNFQALNSIKIKYNEAIDLIYIDPPFNTGSDFAYKDRFQDSTWLTLMENRLTLSKELLSEKGSFYLQLDFNANYYGRILLNETFGKENFINEIIWKRRQGLVNQSKSFGANIDNIILYSKSENYIYNPQYTKVGTEDYIKERYIYEDENGRRYKLGDLGSPSYSPSLVYEYKGYKPPKKGWALSFETMKKFDAEGRIYFPKDKNKRLMRKQYLDEWKGKYVQVLWDDIFPINSQALEKIQGLFTQKPEKLLERIIKASSNPNSIVMDYFSGSGTTINVAFKLNRKFIGVEMGEHFDSVIIPRLKKTLSGFISGISKELEKENNLKKGGIVKYYLLESYEDTLKNASYSLDENSIIDLYSSKKLLKQGVLKEKDEAIVFDYQKIYNDIDIFETISNLTGYKIKKLYKDRCIFLDGDSEIEIKKDELYFSEYKFLRKLIWWK